MASFIVSTICNLLSQNKIEKMFAVLKKLVQKYEVNNVFDK